MEYLEVIRRRRMVRDFDPSRPVSRTIIVELLELAVRAPSAGFSQGWQFLVLTEAADRERFWTATFDPAQARDSWLRGMSSAPVLILAMSDKDAYLDRYAEADKGWTDRDESRWPIPYWDVDTGMASLLILLGAVDQGLAGCFFGVPPAHHGAVRMSFGIDEGLRLVGVIALGHGAPDHRSPSLARGRRPLSEVVSYRRMGLRD